MTDTRTDEHQLVDPVEYAETIKALRRAAAAVAVPLLENGASSTYVYSIVRELAGVGVGDAVEVTS